MWIYNLAESIVSSSDHLFRATGLNLLTHTHTRQCAYVHTYIHACMHQLHHKKDKKWIKGPKIESTPLPSCAADTWMWSNACTKFFTQYKQNMLKGGEKREKRERVREVWWSHILFCRLTKHSLSLPLPRGRDRAAAWNVRIRLNMKNGWDWVKKISPFVRQIFAKNFWFLSNSNWNWL